MDKIYEYSFPEEILSSLKKFPTNITGITVENAINALLQVKKEDNVAFLKENKSHLRHILTFQNTTMKEIPVVTLDDGLLQALNPKDEKDINEINSVTKS